MSIYSNLKNIPNIVEEYNDKGFVIVRNFINNIDCLELVTYLNSLKAKVNLPFTNVPWGYGNLLSVGPFKKISENEFVNKFCRAVLKDKYIFNHLMVHNKAPWVGAGIEWHQEIFNIETYAPGYSAEDWKSFSQIYIALEDQDIENGCLKIVPGSHKLGVLPHEDAINDLLSHKRRVPFDVMQKIYKTNGIMNCELKAGDMLLFNHRIVHGSGSNASPRSRKAIVLQVRADIKKKNDEIFNKETNYRKDFVINSLQEKLKSISEKNIYLDMKKN